MNKNRLTIAAAGSGKTTFLINHALDRSIEESILITTYTEANESEIIKKIHKIKGCIPSNIVVQTWFSFIIQHGVKPFQGSLNDELFDKNIKGMILVNARSGKRYIGKSGPVYFGEESHFEQHYFTKSQKLYSDKLSKFAVKCDKVTKGKVASRISKIFQHIYIDEVQDLAGYDLELIKILFKSSTSVFLVGDPRQVTYLTHNEAMNSKYKDGKIKLYLEEKCKSLIKDGIDADLLNVSHRNNKQICDYSSKLYPEYKSVNPCNCESCRQYPDNHEGVFLVKASDVDEYLAKYNPIQLKWRNSVTVNVNFDSTNFGEAKGQTFDRVLIYPTAAMRNWIIDNSANLSNGARAKLYVALTRARYSAAIVYDYKDDQKIEGILKYTMEE